MWHRLKEAKTRIGSVNGSGVVDRLNRGRTTSWLALLAATAILLCGLVFLIFFGNGGRLALGPCIPGGEGVAEGTSGKAKELLQTRNFEASPKAISDLEAGLVDERLMMTLQAVTEEHRICVDAFKEGVIEILETETG